MGIFWQNKRGESSPLYICIMCLNFHVRWNLHFPLSSIPSLTKFFFVPFHKVPPTPFEMGFGSEHWFSLVMHSLSIWLLLHVDLIEEVASSVEYIDILVKKKSWPYHAIYSNSFLWTLFPNSVQPSHAVSILLIPHFQFAANPYSRLWCRGGGGKKDGNPPAP